MRSRKPIGPSSLRSAIRAVGATPKPGSPNARTPRRPMYSEARLRAALRARHLVARGLEAAAARWSGPPSSVTSPVARPSRPRRSTRYVAGRQREGHLRRPRPAPRRGCPPVPSARRARRRRGARGGAPDRAAEIREHHVAAPGHLELVGRVLRRRPASRPCRRSSAPRCSGTPRTASRGRRRPRRPAPRSATSRWCVKKLPPSAADSCADSPTAVEATNAVPWTSSFVGKANASAGTGARALHLREEPRLAGVHDGHLRVGDRLGRRARAARSNASRSPPISSPPARRGPSRRRRAASARPRSCAATDARLERADGGRRARRAFCPRRSTVPVRGSKSPSSSSARCNRSASFSANQRRGRAASPRSFPATTAKRAAPATEGPAASASAAKAASARIMASSRAAASPGSRRAATPQRARPRARAPRHRQRRRVPRCTTSGHGRGEVSAHTA